MGGKIIIPLVIYVYICVYVCEGSECMRVQMSVESRGIRYPGDGVRGGCEHPGVGGAEN